MKLRYFSWIRERVGTGEEDVVLPENVNTIATLFDWLENRSEEFSSVLEHRNIVRVALDQEHVDDHQTSLEGVNEIALFPPMTGG